MISLCDPRPDNNQPQALLFKGVTRSLERESQALHVSEGGFIRRREPIRGSCIEPATE